VECFGSNRWGHGGAWVLGLVCACLVSLFSGSAIAGTDLNDDGNTDFLWRRYSGQPVAWFMQGLAKPIEQPLTLAPNNSWAILGTGNFDGAGADEVLFLNSSGGAVIWFLSQGQFGTSCVMNLGVPTDTAFVGIGDINGDGKSDVLWQDNGGHIVAWLMNGCTATQTTLASIPTGSAAIAVDDFNGDGYADILWRGAANVYHVILLNGSGVLSSFALNPSISASWQFAATLDLDGDMKADIVWRSTDGSVAVSLMGNAGAHTDSLIAPTAADEIFRNGYEANQAVAVGVLPLDWKLVDVGKYSAGGDRNFLFANSQGDTEIWDVAGVTLRDAVRFPASRDMPFAGGAGWVLPVDRPTVTQVNGQVTVAWPAIPAISSYTIYASAEPNPVVSGAAFNVANQASFTYSRNDPAHVNDRYFSVSANAFGQKTPPSREAYLTEFDQIDLGYVGPMAVSDVDGNGCVDFIGALGDCHGGFTLFSETAMGMSALRAGGRIWRGLFLADFNGDGIDDAIANVYSYDVPFTDPTSHDLLFWGIGDGQFVEDAAFSALNIGGYGETIVVADFDNDGSLDVFLPKYTFYDGSEHCNLLMNDGHGNFTDMADSAGVAMRNITPYYRPEGAEAADIDGDGRIDLYAGSHLFMNRTTSIGHPIFVDQAAERGLGLTFDEGAKFVDWNNDGNLDLIVLSPWAGPLLSQNGGFSFNSVDAMPSGSYNNLGGLNSADIDGDGRPDLVFSGGCPIGLDATCDEVGQPHQQPRLFLNRGSSYVQTFFYDDGYSADSQRPWNDLQTLADFDGSGTMDVVARFPDVSTDTGIQTGTGNTKILMNRARSDQVINVTVVGANGEHNQFGRVVRVSPVERPGFIMTQVVDGGSGYISNTPYTIQFSTPYFGTYRIDVGLADRLVETYAKPGSNVVIDASGNVKGAAASSHVTLRAIVQ